MPPINAAVASKLLPIAPLIVRWVEDLQAKYFSLSQRTCWDFQDAAARFPDLVRYDASYYDQKDPVPVPPLSTLAPGIGVFGAFETATYNGITYGDCVFLRPGLANAASVAFHEMVHVLQFRLFGLHDYFLSYGVGLLENGYRASPIETMAYDLQAIFDASKTDARVQPGQIHTTVAPSGNSNQERPSYTPRAAGLSTGLFSKARLPCRWQLVC